MKYRLAIFDFDGTLADSFPFFAQVINQLAEQHGFKKIDLDLAPTYRQYNARQIMKQVGMPDWKLPFVVKSFTSLMRQNAASISPFEHIDELLLHLANKGVTLAIVSSNSYENVSRILGPANTKLISQFECGMSILANQPECRKCSQRLAFHVAKSSISAIKLPIWRRRVRKKLLLGRCHGGTERSNRSEHIPLKRSSIVCPPLEESPNCRRSDAPPLLLDG